MVIKPKVKVMPNEHFPQTESILSINPFTSGCGHWRARNTMFHNSPQQVNKGKAA